jgi:hypothetical protein
LIGTRIGVAVAIVLALASTAVGVSALMANIRDDGPQTGRMVQTRLTNSYSADPLLFPIDDFFMSRGGDGHMRALYAYPPGFFGHSRGCRVVWDPAATLLFGGTTHGPGLFLDPCGGARFDRDGTLLSGPADHNLDQFTMSATPDGLLVDTRKLYCGDVPPPEFTRAAAEDTPTPAATPEQRQRCPRVTRDTP